MLNGGNYNEGQGKMHSGKSTIIEKKGIQNNYESSSISINIDNGHYNNRGGDLNLQPIGY